MACSKKKCGASAGLTEEQEKILSAMADRNEPCGCKDIAEACGLTSKSVSCKLRSLKTKGYIDSPARCKYAITESGKAALVAA